jgi:predicted DNA-binding helix-hairpin-helix protein
LNLDPKAGWALRHPEFFPVDLQTADYEMILRVPGIGVKSAQLIVSSRRYCKIRLETLKKMGVVLKRAKYFIYHPDIPAGVRQFYPEMIRPLLLAPSKTQQLDLFDSTPLLLPSAPATTNSLPSVFPSTNVIPAKAGISLPKPHLLAAG